MRITDTENNEDTRHKTQDTSNVSDCKPGISRKIFWPVALLFACIILNIFTGCAKKDYLIRAGHYAQESEQYYQKAIDEYRSLIKKGKDQDKYYFALGKLYYRHGEFKEAIEVFKKSATQEAKKFLALSYYHMGNSTDALEIFNREQINDDEYLYYNGLTCERLNLFEEALEKYRKIKDKRFVQEAEERINIIEKQGISLHIKDISRKVHKMLSSAPTQEQYPQAGALILYCDEKVEVSKDNTQITEMHYLIKILNKRGKEGFSEAHIDYDSTYEKVELEYARIIKPNGTVVDVGSRHIRDVSKYLNFPLYSNVRVYIISFPEITEGTAIEYKIKIYNNRLINKEDFVLNYPVQAKEPIITANFSISVPKEKSLHIKIINDKYNNFAANLNASKEEKGGSLIYNWRFKDIPQIIPESNMPPVVQINPTMLISTFTSWQDIYDWWWSLAKDKIKADSAIKEKVRELISGKKFDEEKAREIYNFCAQKIRYVAVEYGEAGFEPHYATDIFKNRYGDCKDQAMLLVTMLKEAGLEAWPVLVATKKYYNLNEDFPSVLFNHCIAAINLENEVIFLDPTAETCSFGDLPPNDQERKTLIFKKDGFKILKTPLYPAQHNLVKQLLEVKVNDDETIAAQKTVFTHGCYDQAQRYWLLYIQPELIQEALKEKIQDISIGAKLDSYSIRNLEDLNSPIELNYAFKGTEYFTAAGNLRIFPQLAGLDTSLVAKDRRKYDLDFNVLDSKETIFEIEIPQNIVVKYIPDSVAEDSPWLRFLAEYKCENNRIYFREKTELKKNVVSEGEYPDFKNFFEGLAKKIKQRIILEEKK